MKKIATILLIVFSGSISLAQFSTGAVGFSVVAGTSVAIDKLVLTPDQNLTIAETELTISNVPISGIPSASVSKVYTITPSTLSYKGTVGFHFLDSELNGNLKSNLTLVYNPDSEGDDSYVTTSPGTVTGNYVSQYFGTAVDLGKITATSVSSSLPVRLVRFEVKKAGSVARIEWATAQEINNSHFIVERSADARTFTTLSKVSAIVGSGVKNEYVAFDEAPEKSVTYYRLKQVDMDGSATTFGIRAFHADQNVDGQRAYIYPMPAQDHFRINLPEKPNNGLVFSLLDINGKAIFSKPASSKDTDYEIKLPEGTPPGTYILKVTGDEINQSVKVKIIR